MKKFIAAIVGVLSVTLILCACSWKANNKTRNYFAMSTDELAKLSDNELYKAVVARAERKVESQTDFKTGVNSLNSSQKIVFSLDWFIMEEDNGGLFQFLVNSSRLVAPFISDYMGQSVQRNTKSFLMILFQKTILIYPIYHFLI